MLAACFFTSVFGIKVGLIDCLMPGFAVGGKAESFVGGAVGFLFHRNRLKGEIASLNRLMDGKYMIGDKHYRVNKAESPRGERPTRPSIFAPPGTATTKSLSFCSAMRSRLRSRPRKRISNLTLLPSERKRSA